MYCEENAGEGWSVFVPTVFAFVITGGLFDFDCREYCYKGDDKAKDCDGGFGIFWNTFGVVDNII